MNISTRWTDGIGCGSNGARSRGHCGNQEGAQARRPRCARIPAGAAHAVPGSVEASAARRSREGLAEYTGTVLAAASAADAIASAIEQLADAEAAARTASFARLRTRLVRRMACCSMHRLPAGRDGCAAPTISARCDACACGSTGHGCHGVCRPIRRRRDSRVRTAARATSGRNVSPNCAGASSTVRCCMIPGGSHSYDTRGAVVIPGSRDGVLRPFPCIGSLGHARSGEGRAGCE